MNATKLVNGLLKKYPYLIPFVTNITFNYINSSEVDSYLGFVTNKDSIYRRNKSIITIIANEKDPLEHILLHELTHLTEMHTEVEIAKNIIEKEFNLKFDTKLYTIACEYTVARLMQEVYNDSVLYEKAYLDFVHELNSSIAILNLKDVNHLSIYKLLYKDYQNYKQQNKNKRESGGNAGNDGQCDSDNNDGNNDGNNDNGVSKHNSLQEVMKKSKDSKKGKNKDNNGNNDKEKDKNHSGKLAGDEHYEEAKEIYKFEDVKKYVKVNRVYLTGESMLDSCELDNDPIADLKNKIRDIVRIITKYDWYSHDFITRPDFDYFIPAMKTPKKNLGITLVVDVSGSMGDYIKELLKFVNEYANIIDYIIVHDAKIVQTIDLRKSKFKANETEIKITHGGTSFKDSYEFIIENNLHRNRLIVHITDLFTDYDELDIAVANFDIIYLVKENEYNREALIYLQNEQLRSNKKHKLEIFEYKINDKKKLAV